MIARECLDSEMNKLVLELTMMPHGTTPSYGSSGGGHADSKPPTGDSHPEVDHLVKLYQAAWSIPARERVIGMAKQELESWRTKRKPAASEKSLDEVILEDGEGFAAEMVAQRYGLAVGHVCRIRARAGRNPQTGTSLDAQSLPRDARRAEARRMKDKGMSNRQIGAILACDEITVRRDLAPHPTIR
jgi:hypothetical protein